MNRINIYYTNRLYVWMLKEQMKMWIRDKSVYAKWCVRGHRFSGRVFYGWPIVEPFLLECVIKNDNT